MVTNFLEIQIIKVESTLCYDLYKNVLARDYNYLPITFQKIITFYSTIVSHAYFDNLFVYQKLNCMIDTVNTISNKVILNRLEPVNLKRFGQTETIVKSVNEVVEKFSQTKVEADEEIIRNFNHRVRLLRFCFLMSLDGLDFGTLITTAIIHLKEAKKHNTTFAFDFFNN